MKPQEFVKIEILKSLINNISNLKALKCLSLILSCDDCQHHAIELKLENILLDVLVKSCDDETKSYAIMAMRNFLMYKNIYNEEFPWKRLLLFLIEGAYTKINEILQESCVQTLRIMSDATIVKDYLRKNHITKLRNIPSLTARTVKMKEDLLEWLKYRNYKSNSKCEKYSKLFV